jgi:hypothetical protein
MMGQIRPQAEATFERTNAKISDHRLSLLSPAVAWFRAASLAGNLAAIDMTARIADSYSAEIPRRGRLMDGGVGRVGRRCRL